jgi:hypothetical protein
MPMQIIHERLFVDKVIAPDIDERGAQCHSLNQRAVPWFAHNGIDGRQQRFEGEREGLGRDESIAVRRNGSVEQEAIAGERRPTYEGEY